MKNVFNVAVDKKVIVEGPSDTNDDDFSEQEEVTNYSEEINEISMSVNKTTQYRYRVNYYDWTGRY
jgi:hypothetical protein